MPIDAHTGLISDVVVPLPAHDVQTSCGLSLDIGSTVGKIIYRSNKEYKNGQPLKPQAEAARGQVHYAMFPRSDVKGMVKYVQENCDLTRNKSGDLDVLSAGVGGAAFRTDVESGLNCKLKIVSEADCFCKAFLALEKVLTKEDFFVPLSQKTQDEIAATKALMQALSQKGNEESEIGFGAVHDGPPVVVEDRPRLLVMAGSGTGIMEIKKDGSVVYMDAISTAGRFMYGLASFLTGENDYNKLVAMAEQADGKTVDLWESDSNPNAPSAEDGLYGGVGEGQDFMTFPFGKGIDTPREEAKQADLAYSTFGATAVIHAQQVHTDCKLAGASHVYFCGNMFNSQLMMALLMKKMIELQTIFPAKDPYEVHFIRNGGMLGAMGAFLTVPKEDEQTS